MLKKELLFFMGLLLVGCPATGPQSPPSSPSPLATASPTATATPESCGFDCGGVQLQPSSDGRCPAVASCAPTPEPVVTDTPKATSTPTASATPESTPTPAPAVSATPANQTVSFSTVNTTLQNRCAPCHISGSSGGANFSTPDGIKKFAERIKVRVFDQKTMPPGNSDMTDAERQQIADWHSAGAPID